VDEIITDAGVEADYVRAIEERGPEVTIVPV
jgi:hypothetical protein